MGLFEKIFTKSKKDSQTPAASSQETPAAPVEHNYVLAANYKGFKKMPMEVNFYPECAKNNLLFKDKDVNGHPFLFRDGGGDKIAAYLDEILIGYVTDQSCISSIRSGSVEKVHINFETTTVLKNGKSEDRFRAHLIVKYQDI